MKTGCTESSVRWEVIYSLVLITGSPQKYITLASPFSWQALHGIEHWFGVLTRPVYLWFVRVLAMLSCPKWDCVHVHGLLSHPGCILQCASRFRIGSWATMITIKQMQRLNEGELFISQNRIMPHFHIPTQGILICYVWCMQNIVKLIFLKCWLFAFLHTGVTFYSL